MTDAAQRFTLLYDQCQPRVLAYARSRASLETAEEVTSATFLVAWEHLDRLPEPALPWLLAVGRNLIRKHYTQAGQQQATVAVLAALAASDPPEGDIAEVVVERSAMLGALAMLPAYDQEVLTLVGWHGLTAREAARVVGCSRVAFFVRLHRARRRLEAAVEQSASRVSAPPRRADAGSGAGTRPQAVPRRPHPAPVAKTLGSMKER